MELKGKKINFLGDSITEGVGTSGKEHMFVNLIAERTGAICRNYGISGARIARQLNPDPNRSYDEKDFCRRAPFMDKDADIVIVFGGTNDFGHGDAPMGEFTDHTDATFYGAMHVLCRTLINMYPEGKIVFLTPLHRELEDNPNSENRKPVAGGTLKQYVYAMREVLEYYSLPVLDLYASSGLQPNVEIIKQKYVPDGLHPNDAGNAVLADCIINYLKNAF